MHSEFKKQTDPFKESDKSTRKLYKWFALILGIPLAIAIRQCTSKQWAPYMCSKVCESYQGENLELDYVKYESTFRISCQCKYSSKRKEPSINIAPK